MLIDYIDIDRIVEDRRLDPIYYGLAFFNEQIQYPLAPLKSFCLDFQSGFGAGKEEQTTEETGIIQIRPTNIDSEGMLKYDKNVFVPYTLNKTLLEIDDVLFNNTNSQELVGKTAILKEQKKLFFSNHITRIQVDKTKAIPDYLWIILNMYQSKSVFYSICTNWNNQSGVGIELLKSLKIPLPRREIQQQIVDLNNAAIKEKQAKEQEANELLASIDDYLLKELGIELPVTTKNERYFEVNILDLIGERLDPFYNNPLYAGIDEKISAAQYSFRKFKEICYSVSGVVFSCDDESEKGKAILRGNNITLETNELNFDSIRYIRDSLIISDNLKLQRNDILMSSASGSKEHVGKVAFIEYDMDYYFGGFMMVLRQKEKDYNQKYFFAFLQSNLFRSYLYRNLGGTNINNLNFKMLANLKIPFPPIEKQNDIAEHIKSIRVKAKQLQKDAREGLIRINTEIEKIIIRD